MSSITIQGGAPLHGTVRVSGAKNSVLPIMAASLLAEEMVTLSNVPQLRDVNTLIELLSWLGLQCHWYDSNTLQLLPGNPAHYSVPYPLMRTMRASILILGPLLSRYGQALVSMPGGCALGQRPIDIHLHGLRAMGAEIKLDDDNNLHATAERGLRGAEITMPVVTVTGTENLMLAATLAHGTTILHNAAREPEIVDLANFLNQLGAKISAAGSTTITIEGVKRLRGGHYHIMPDRLEAATWLSAAMVTAGNITVEAVEPSHLETLVEKLVEAGATISVNKNAISLNMIGRRPLAVDFTTAPYPGFATDMQPLFMTVNAIAAGESHIVETLFENRFLYVPELIRMGADMVLNGQRVHCRGVEQLTAAPVMATDLRAAASLMIAALAAKGETVIHCIDHIDRGYANIETKLAALGANAKRSYGEMA
ncbi:MAG: UDP-N-acetylglucosamine 1-carboxyvinyltransferase [Gammaproteobacteria bacterium]|nr:UDP-N-acetylglucosamine 1-carboxyvinyltransferase [Gammaproteobacteria bacterium]